MAESKKKPTKKTIKPGKEIVESVVEDLKDKILKMVNQDIEELVLDLKNVKEIDSCGLGLLIAAKNSLDQAGGQLNLTNVPENFEDLLQVLGLDSFFNPGTA